jgi:uridine kinase
VSLPAREKVLVRVADHLLGLDTDHPLRVAVDGVTASGKSTFAAELTAAIAERGRPAIHLSTDEFHRQRAYRHRQDDPAAGYYDDAYDYDAIARLLLDPLGPGGDRGFRRRSHDLTTDELIDESAETADADAIVVVDGSFLQRPELAELWDEVIFLDTTLETAQNRGVQRDGELLGGATAAARAFSSRYHAAGRRYLDEERPCARASIVVDNEDVTRPVLRRIGGTEADTAQLFSYGTLQQDGVQLRSFGRLLKGTDATLPHHYDDWVQITDPDVIATSGSNRHPIVRPRTDPYDEIAGTVFTVTTMELAAADDYEVEDYRRVRVTLGSGRPAWVYLAAD